MRGALKILDVARIVSRSLDLDLVLEIFDLLGLMTTLISDYSKQANRNNISMKLENDGKDMDLDIHFEKQEIVKLFVYADKNRIIQVLSNILINALKFTKKGSITIVVKKT